MVDFFQYEQTLKDLDESITYKQSELERVKATDVNDVVKNTVISALEQDLTELRGKRACYTQFFTELFMKNTGGSCWCSGGCCKYY